MTAAVRRSHLSCLHVTPSCVVSPSVNSLPVTSASAMLSPVTPVSATLSSATSSSAMLSPVTSVRRDIILFLSACVGHIFTWKNSTCAYAVADRYKTNLLSVAKNLSLPSYSRVAVSLNETNKLTNNLNKMKRNLLKTMLVAVGLVAGMSGAWADEITATLVHTAATSCGTDKTVITGTVDSDKEHYNNEGSNQWQGYAFAEFTFDDLPENATITAASLDWTVTSSNNKGTYSTNIYYLNSGLTLDYDQISSSTPALLRFNGVKTLIKSYSTSDIPKTGGSYTENVLDAIKAIIESGEKTIIFQWTGNNRGGDLAGKASEKAPVLKLTYSLATFYKATFTEKKGLNPNVTVYSDAERTTTISADLLSANTKYYYTATLAGYEDYKGEFEVGETDVTVEFEMVANPPFSYSVNLVDEDDNVLKSVYSNAEVTVGTQIDYAYPKYLTDENGKVTHVCSVATYSGRVSPTSEGSIDIKYSAYNGTAYFAEAENALSLTATVANSKLSSGVAVRGGNKTIKFLDVVESGIYKVTCVVFSNNLNATRTLDVLRNDDILESIDINWSVNSATSSGIRVINDVTLFANDVINVKPSDTQVSFDYILIEKTGEATTTVTVPELSYATYCPAYPVEFAADGAIEAYKASVDEMNSVVNLTRTYQVAEGEGVLIHAKDGGAATEEVNIIAPIEKDANNAFVGTLEDMTVTEENYGTVYFFGNGSKGLGFYKAANGGTLAAGKAYLLLDNASGAKSYSIAFGGDTTGINEVVATAKADGTFYTLSGVRVEKPAKGLYIQNGKKVVIK